MPLSFAPGEAYQFDWSHEYVVIDGAAGWESDDGDRQMVKILSAVLTDGLQAVETACAESLDAGVASADVVLNVLARRSGQEPTPPILTPERLALTVLPVADCARYDRLRILALEAPRHEEGMQS